MSPLFKLGQFFNGEMYFSVMRLSVLLLGETHSRGCKAVTLPDIEMNLAAK